MKTRITVISLIAALMLSSCGTASPESVTSPAESATEAAAEEVTEEAAAEEAEAPTEEPAEETEAPATEPAAEHETAPQNEVGYEGMEAVYADALKEGDYHIDVDSSSSMFKIADCILHVADGSMTADIIIASKSYDKLFMGSEDEANKAGTGSGIGYTENEDGQSVFTVPIEALDMETECAALSAKKQEWYGRKLVFRADSLPDTAFNETRYTTVESLDLADGVYTVDVKLDGGSGRASVESPAVLTVRDGKSTAKIVWSSDKYDKMVVDDLEYTPEISDGHSIFEIPVTGFDYRMPVQAETTAMSEPHMIDYTLYFDSATIKS